MFLSLLKTALLVSCFGLSSVNNISSDSSDHTFINNRLDNPKSANGLISSDYIPVFIDETYFPTALKEYHDAVDDDYDYWYTVYEGNFSAYGSTDWKYMIVGDLYPIYFSCVGFSLNFNSSIDFDDDVEWIFRHNPSGSFSSILDKEFFYKNISVCHDDGPTVANTTQKFYPTSMLEGVFNAGHVDVVIAEQFNFNALFGVSKPNGWSNLTVTSPTTLSANQTHDIIIDTNPFCTWISGRMFGNHIRFRFRSALNCHYYSGNVASQSGNEYIDITITDNTQMYFESLDFGHDLNGSIAWTTVAQRNYHYENGVLYLNTENYQESTIVWIRPYDMYVRFFEYDDNINVPNELITVGCSQYGSPTVNVYSYDNLSVFTKISNLFKIVFTGLVPILNYALLPGITFGVLVFAPFFVTLIVVIVRLIKR